MTHVVSNRGGDENPSGERQFTQRKDKIIYVWFFLGTKIPGFFKHTYEVHGLNIQKDWLRFFFYTSIHKKHSQRYGLKEGRSTSLPTDSVGMEESDKSVLL